MKPPMRHRMLLTHVAAILLGSIGGKILLDFSSSPEPLARGMASRPVMDASSAWLNESLRSVRQEKAEHERKSRKPATLAEELRSNREKADQERREYEERVDLIVKSSAAHAREPDPAAAIRKKLRVDRWQDDQSLEIFQAWLDRDPEAALAELAGNWQLLEKEDIPMMLEREFGRQWLERQFADENAPYRLRLQLADGLGRNLAWDGGMDGLLKQYALISDPKLKMRLAAAFSGSWPLDDPGETARFLGRDMPVELRDELLDDWKPPDELGPLGSRGASFSAGVWMPPAYSTGDWFEKLCDAMDPDLLPEDLKDPTFVQTPETGRESESIGEGIRSNMGQGMTREGAVEFTLLTMIAEVMGEGADLTELYGEGKISRSVLLQELNRRIPGGEKYPDELERQAWILTSVRSDPTQVMAWAKAVSISEEVKRYWISNSMPFSRDPRMKANLERFRTFAAAEADEKFQSMAHRGAFEAFQSWAAISPSAADAWRRSIPADGPLAKAIREKEELEKKRKEAP